MYVRNIRNYLFYCKLVSSNCNCAQKRGKRKMADYGFEAEGGRMKNSLYRELYGSYPVICKGRSYKRIIDVLMTGAPNFGYGGTK